MKHYSTLIKTLTFCLSFFFNYAIVNAQNISQKDMSNRFLYAAYMMGQEKYSIVDQVLNSIQSKYHLSSEGLDSLYYLLGFSKLYQKDLDLSQKYLMKISNKSSNYIKSRLYSAYINTYLGILDQSNSILNQLEINTDEEKEIVNFNKSVNSLLASDTVAFNQYAKNYSYQYFFLKEPEKIMMKMKDTLSLFKPKSYFAAGFLSAMVPGLGKFYTRRPGEGLSTFFINAILIAMFMEKLEKAGPKKPGTYITGALLSVFYIGNIYGSVISVKTYRDEFETIRKNKILFNLHIPLRNFYD